MTEYSANENLLQAEQYLIALDSKEPNNYTMVPNIIDHLTYDEIDEKTGQTIIKRLSVFAIHLYRILRHLAGQDNLTWKSTQNIAEIANMSSGQVSKCKKELMNKFHELDGNPLIQVEEKEKSTFADNKKINGTIYHRISIINIWGWNRAYFLNEKVRKDQARSPHERADQARSPHERAPQEARSPHERNKNNNNIPLSKEQQPTKQPVCSLNKEDSVPSDSSTLDEKKLSAFNWFLKIGCDVVSATFFIQRFSIQDISEASSYVAKQIEKKRRKNQKIDNIVGYLRKTLEGKYWKQVQT